MTTHERRHLGTVASTGDRPRQELPGPHKRSIRNYLLDSRFQLKYTAMIVSVAVVISAVLGTALYVTTRNMVGQSQKVVEESTKVTEESKKVSDVSRMNVKELASDSPELLAEFNKEAAETDKVVADQQKAVVDQQAALIRRQADLIWSLVGGLLLMVFAIGVLSIYFTHKVVGPIYKMKRLLKQVGEGSLRVDARLRKGDELQDFFQAFQDMVASLRNFEKSQLSELEIAIGALEQKTDQEARAALARLRDSMLRSLEG
jgi:nitrogen fixation/metabolism regulation signal transduction histidine kinase